MNSGTGIYFDGMTSARHAVQVLLGPSSLTILDREGRSFAEWPYDAIDELAAPDNLLRLGLRNNPVLARLEIADPAFAAVVDDLTIHVDRTGGLRRRQRIRVIGWSLAATVSLVLVAWFGVPAIAERLAPLVPAGLERRLGDAVDMQVRSMLDTGNVGDAFECGTSASGRAGAAALGRLMQRLQEAASLDVPLRPVVIRRKEANAMALPGGRIYVFEGLIAKASNADEVAGVIAHEIGHVAHRDGTKALLQAGGLSFLFGMLLGDFVGGGAVVIAAKNVLQSSYSREAETRADAYAVSLMGKAGGDAGALATMLDKIGGATEPGMKILLDHPETKARVAAIRAAAKSGPTTPFLAAPEWAALRRICAG